MEVFGLLQYGSPPEDYTGIDFNPMNPHSLWNVGTGNAFVEISAILLLVLMYDIFILLDCTHSHIKWYLMSMCLTHEWSDGSSERFIAELLSQLIMVGLTCLNSVAEVRS